MAADELFSQTPVLGRLALPQPAPGRPRRPGAALLSELGDVRARFPTEDCLAPWPGRAGHHHLGQTPSGQVPLGV